MPSWSFFFLSIWYILKCYSKQIKVHIGLKAFFKSSLFFLQVIYSFGLLLRSFSPHILIQNCSFWFLSFRLSICLCVFYPLLSRIFFRYFLRSCFTCIASFCPEIFWVSLLSPISFGLFLPVVLSVLSAVFFFSSFIPSCPCVFSLSLCFYLFSEFLYSSF